MAEDPPTDDTGRDHLMSPDLTVGIIAFAFTLMTLSYLVADNPAFRFAIHVFVGVAAGYVAAVAWWQVLWPDLLLPLAEGTAMQRAALALPLLLSGMLLMKAWPPLSRIGAPAMGLLVGAAAAVAVGGGAQGTIVPQAAATVDAFGVQQAGSFDSLLNALLVLAGVVFSLAYFHFSRPRTMTQPAAANRVWRILTAVGGLFLAVTLGVLFAGVYSAALTAMIERLHFLATFLGLL
jgi:hypothetical protein